MKIRITALAAASALAAVAAIGTASATPAAPKPGFLPGAWIGKGQIKGYAVDGPMATHFDGGIAFTIKVDRKLRVSGGGTWKLNMLGSEDAPSEYAVDSTMRGTASIRLTGVATNVAFSGTQHVVGEIRSGSMRQPISFDRPFKGALAITRAGKCKVLGRTTVQQGVTLSWSAQLKGSGTCNA